MIATSLLTGVLNMGSKKLLKKLAEFFDMDARARQHKKQELSDLLGRLKQKEVELKAQLQATHDEEEISELQQKIDVVHSQRKKGLEMVKQLKPNHNDKA